MATSTHAATGLTGQTRTLHGPTQPQPTPSISNAEWLDLYSLPDCETCDNLRHIRADHPVGHPHFGKLIPCPECGEQADRVRRARVYGRQRARIEQYTVPRSGRQTFDAFAPREDEDNTASVRLALLTSIAFANAPKGWLVLVGSNGTGKTHLAHAIAHAVEEVPIEQRPLVLVITAPSLLDLLRSGYVHGDYHELLDLAQRVDLLILDDLGTERETDWAFEKLFQILNHRYQGELPTVVVTNCRPEHLEPRLYDRLSDEGLCKVVTVLAPTYRQRRAAPGKVVQ